ncbi:AMP-binding protein [Dactylosporangium sp. NPDC051484]|uniref:class I adenylate-forming enzyme family protein n=1 Tax=Dactylosporangium sp. NPDC051484 TaxID=3154942 RepID=UPI00344DAF84
MYVERLLEILARGPEQPALWWQDRPISRGRLRAEILAVAAALHTEGIGPGRTVAILTRSNAPATLTVRYAAHRLGATVTHVRSMNARADGDHLPVDAQARILAESGTTLLVTDAANAGRAALLAGRVPGLRVRDVAAPAPVGVIAPVAEYRPEAVAVIDLTSGTTNAPKLVRQTYAARAARVAGSFGERPPRDRPVLLSVTPISQATATLVDAVLLHEGTIVLHGAFDADAFLDAVARHRVTDVYLAVPHLYRLIDRPGIGEADLSSLRAVIYSGTVATPERIAVAYRIFGDRLAQLYGSTEAGGMCSLSPLDHTEPELLASVGRPFPWLRLRLCVPGTDEPVVRGGVGEVGVAGDTLMAGYLGDPGPDAPVLRDGWLRTGDLGRLDRYGYLHLIGRTGNVIKANGLKIYPAEVERALLGHPEVAEAVVYQVVDPDRGELAHAAVQWRPGASRAVPPLRAHLTATLSAAHVPAVFHSCERIPLLPSGKPDVAALRLEGTVHQSPPAG